MCHHRKSATATTTTTTTTQSRHSTRRAKFFICRARFYNSPMPPPSSLSKTADLEYFDFEFSDFDRADCKRELRSCEINTAHART